MLPARHRLRTAADFSAVVRGAGAARWLAPWLKYAALYRTDGAERPTRRSLRNLHNNALRRAQPKRRTDCFAVTIKPGRKQQTRLSRKRQMPLLSC